MRHVVPTIWEAVEVAANAGEAIEVETYCRRYKTLCPELSAKEIRYVILEAIAYWRGVAVWADDLQ